MDQSAATSMPFAVPTVRRNASIKRLLKLPIWGASDRPSSTSIVRQPSDRRVDPNSSNSSQIPGGNNSSELTTSHSIDADACTPDAELEHRDNTKSKSAPVSVNRSESYKERLSHKRNRNNRRKTSDPSLSSKTNDDQHVELGINNANFTASSSSSLSSSLGSPSTSLEAVGAPAGQGIVSSTAPRQWVDSEDEAGDLEPDWSSNVGADILQTLSDAEKKRQEIINEIYQTEKNHVRTLRLLEGIFMRPLQETGVLSADHLNLLFPPSLLVLKDLHGSFEQQLKQRRIDHGPLVGNIGDLLLTMFDGTSGDDLREHAAQFCARQQIALEALKEKRRKDEQLQRLLTKAESHKACRRLQLKDLLPTALQRLTKYPLLFESLVKITVRVAPDNESEAQAIQRALDSSRRILDHVNQAVREAEDAHKLQTIQKRLDKSSYEKEANNEFKNLDLTHHKLIYDGPLIMKKNPNVQLHGLLFETMMVLLIKQDDKYILKYQSSPGLGSGESRSIEGRFNPITKINLIFVRQSAVEKNTFFLINTNVSQMLELTAPSGSECKTWFKHISEAAEAYKLRTKGNHDVVPLVDDPATVTLSNSSTKESLEPAAEHELVGDTVGAVAVAIAGGSQKNAPRRYGSDVSDNIETIFNNSSGGGGGSGAAAKNEENGYSNIDGNGGGHGTASGNPKPDKSCEYDAENGGKATAKIRSDSFSNNSNSTRTLTQQSSLVAPSEVHISVNPALTAEPVFTPTERLRRLDESIRLTLAEKQKIVCDIFRVPNEHFSAIADIAGQPEAPKEPADIVLAAFAQVQSLTETLNDYIKVSQQQDPSAVSTLLCDDCYTKSQDPQQSKSQILDSKDRQPSSTRGTSANSSSSHSITVPTVVTNKGGVTHSPPTPPPLDTNDFIQDDDGYCEIDEIRMPAIIKTTPSSTTAAIANPELKRQGTTNTDSIPEETENEIISEKLSDAADKLETLVTSMRPAKVHDDTNNDNDSQSADDKLNAAASVGNMNTKCADEAIEIVTSDSITQPTSEVNFCMSDTCGAANRSAIAHARAIAPVIPCHLISAYVSALNLQISQLLPKLNERDIEREKLRRENQHLRDLLNSMHERVQVSNDKETPEDGMSSQGPSN